MIDVYDPLILAKSWSLELRNIISLFFNPGIEMLSLYRWQLNGKERCSQFIFHVTVIKLYARPLWVWNAREEF